MHETKKPIMSPENAKNIALLASYLEIQKKNTDKLKEKLAKIEREQTQSTEKIRQLGAKTSIIKNEVELLNQTINQKKLEEEAKLLVPKPVEVITKVPKLTPIKIEGPDDTDIYPPAEESIVLQNHSKRDGQQTPAVERESLNIDGDVDIDEDGDTESANSEEITPTIIPTKKEKKKRAPKTKITPIEEPETEQVSLDVVQDVTKIEIIPETTENTNKVETKSGDAGELVVTDSKELAKISVEVLDDAIVEVYHKNESVFDEAITVETGKKKVSAKEKVAWFKNKIIGVFDTVKEKIAGKKVFTESAKALMRKGVMIMTFSISTIASADSRLMQEGFTNLPIDTSTEALARMDREYITETVADITVYDSLSTQGKQVYLDICAGTYKFENGEEYNKPYIIIDKQTAKEYVFNNDNTLVACFPVLLGATEGDGPNRAHPSTDTPGSQATTPMGEFDFTYGGSSDAESTYEGRYFAILGASLVAGVTLAMHQTYPGELKARTKALDSQTIEDNRVSWGCINADQKVFDQYLLPTFNKSSVYKIFILPDSPDQVFVP